MSILVVCHSCKKSFQVSEKFAGKSGPCPKCKATIQIPLKAEEVKVHAPTEFAGGGRSTTGQLLIKPIARQKIKLNPVLAASIAGGVLVVLALTWMAGGLLKDYYVVRALGLLAVTPPLVYAAYTFLRDTELEPYGGKEFYIRAAACTLAYAVLWAVFAYVRDEIVQPEQDQLFMWLILVAPFLGLGTLTAWAALDLEPASGFFHYMFYLLVTSILGCTAGLYAWVAVLPVAV